MHGVDVYPSLSSLPLLTSLLMQDYLWWLGRRGIPPPSNIVPGWLHPGPQAPGVESRHRAGLTVVGPLYPNRLPRSNKHTGEGGVVISSIRYSTHPDIRSSLSLLISWLTLVPIWICKVSKNNHGTWAQACKGTNTHASLSYCDIIYRWLNWIEIIWSKFSFGKENGEKLCNCFVWNW